MSFLNFGAHNKFVKRLMIWRQADDEQWACKAIESLVRKLSKNTCALAELELALANQTSLSKCVTIPRSLDGRLQVSHRKGLPHVIYCRVWRWPDLKSHHELKAIEECHFAYHLNKTDVCINPYHYDRVEIPTLPPVMVPRYDNQEKFKFQDNGVNLQLPSDCIMPVSNSQITTFQNELTTLSNVDQSQNINFINQTDLNSILSYMLMDYVPVEYTDRQDWCQIFYFELGVKISETFTAKNQAVIVDGFTSPFHNGDRFSLGSYTNIRRTAESENVRKYIGKGIYLYNDHGDVFIECMSNVAVFVQTRSGNLASQLHPDTVCKLLPGCSMQVFHARPFGQALSQLSINNYEQAFRLNQFCFVRVSFVKGWGAQYNRLDVSNTPCWIEIKLLAPLAWLDKVLTVMNCPKNPISSVS